MKARSLDPHRLDVEVLAREGAEIAGSWSIDAFERLREVQVPGTDAPRAVAWSARGELRQPRVGDPEIWLHLQASARLWLQCQRCLQAVDTAVSFDRAIRFVRSEEEAATLDADIDDDVLALARALDLRELVEDELLLALPLVPRHDECPTPLPLPNEDPPADSEQPNPFAALAALRRNPSDPGADG
jgi:uncharacterized protein